MGEKTHSTGQASSVASPTKPKVRRALLPIIDRRFQFKVTLLVVGVITVTHLLVGGYMYQSIAEFARKLSDFVPDLQQDAEYFRGWILKYMLLTIVTTFITIILLSLYFSARISGPLYNMTRVFGLVARGDFSRRVVLRKYDELKEFSENANRLFSNLEAREKKLKEILAEMEKKLGERADPQILSLIKAATHCRIEESTDDSSN